MDINTLVLNNMTAEIFDKIIKSKKELTASINKVGKVESIRDFGGMWKVNGTYLLEGAKDLKVKRASMVDKLITDHYKKQVEEYTEQYGIKFKYDDVDFRDLADAKLGPMDVSLFNDVLLHQDNFTEVIRQTCNITNRYIVVAQPFYEGFDIPSSCSMIQFMDEKWKKKLYNFMWIDQRELDKFSVDIWMWAQSTQLMIDIFKGYGWKVREDLGSIDFEIENDWHYRGLIFGKM